MSAEGSELDEVEIATRRFHVLKAVVAAQERYPDVAEAIASAVDRPAAKAAIQELLGTTEYAAEAVIDLPWRNLTAERREYAREDLADVRQWLVDRLGDEP